MSMKIQTPKSSSEPNFFKSSLRRMLERSIFLKTETSWSCLDKTMKFTYKISGLFQAGLLLRTHHFTLLKGSSRAIKKP